MPLTNKLYLIVCLVVLYIPVSQAEKVYRSVDSKGVVEFSDEYKKGAKEVDVKDTSTYKAVKVKPVITPAKPVVAALPAASRIQIISPTAKETIRNNPGNMSVVVSLQQADKDVKNQPQASAAKGVNGLKQGQKIVLSMDGKVIRETDQTTIELKNVARGAHQLQAVLISADGKQLAESDSVEFFMKRFSILFKSSKNPPGAAPK